MDNLKEYLETLIAELNDQELSDDAYDEYVMNLASGGNHDDTFSGGYSVGYDAGMRNMAEKILNRL